MKIKDIVHEGFVSSFAKGLLPDTLQKTMSSLAANKVYAEPSEKELAQAAYEKFGASPDYDEKKAQELLARTTDPARRQKIQNILGKMSWLKDQEKIKQKAELKQKLRNAPPATPPAPSSVSSPLHPDVQVVNSGVNAILRYRGRDYERDEYTGSWFPVGGKKKASPGVSSFLNTELSKL